VNISSINARLPFPMVVDHSAAKAALTNLNKSLSEEFAPQGVRVNAIAPGPVRTPFWTAPGGFADATAAATGTTAQEALDAVVPQSMGISSGRVTEAHEVADLTLFLASPSPPTSRERRPSSTAARPRHSDARPPARHPPPAPRGRASQDCARKGNPGGQRALSARRTRSLHAA
jgi:NAD(P)-dependent dehydrogenase (short-subunit alcohol dehydrogenase family)